MEFGYLFQPARVKRLYARSQLYRSRFIFHSVFSFRWANDRPVKARLYHNKNILTIVQIGEYLHIHSDRPVLVRIRLDRIVLALALAFALLTVQQVLCALSTGSRTPFLT